MGFIDSSKNLWSIALTRIGREYLAKDSPRFTLDKVSFSDSEVNYCTVSSTEKYDSDVITLPVLESSTLSNTTFNTSLICKSYYKENENDNIPEFEWRIDILFSGSNVFVLDNTIDSQYFDVSFFYLAPNNTSINQWQLSHAAIIDMTRFLKYYSFMFDFEPIFPSNAIISQTSTTSSPYWYTWEEYDNLKQNIINLYSGLIKNWSEDASAIINSKWNISDKYVLNDSSYVSLPEYRSYDTGKSSGATFRLKIKKEMISRLYQYMNEYKVDMIKDYIYIINNDPQIKPVTTIYDGSNKFSAITKRIPIYITKILKLGE
jgi:hypothetical protein